ncbi:MULTISPECIES: hypothetical protein [Ruminococcus]|uniref:hypothetical protein n=1 Tax=Ruminococcus TaxID=1263 RepID=UPI0004652FD0|nr:MULTISPECIES: hypothetical protein [Ruminococcus]MCR5021645.1 hypothetical protein [Ruminococcus sp.]
MYVQVRLYVHQDNDLMMINNAPGFNLDTIIHDAVCAFVRGEDFEIPSLTIKKKNMKDSGRICVTFDERSDADVISYLKTVRYGFMNDYLKQITKRYIQRDMFEAAFCAEEGENNKSVKGVVYHKKRVSLNEEPKEINVSKKNDVLNVPGQDPAGSNIAPAEPAVQREITFEKNINDTSDAGNNDTEEMVDLIDSLIGI